MTKRSVRLLFLHLGIRASFVIRVSSFSADVLSLTVDRNYQGLDIFRCPDLLEELFRLPQTGSSGRTMAMIRLLSSRPLEGKRIRPNNPAFNCRIISPLLVRS